MLYVGVEVGFDNVGANDEGAMVGERVAFTGRIVGESVGAKLGLIVGKTLGD
jgi:hypothetical protein